MRASLRTSVVVVFCLVFSAGAAFSQEKKPELTLAQREKIEALQKKSLQLYIQMNQIQQRYQSALQADPQYSGLSSENTKTNEELTAAVEEAQKGIDQKKWRLDPNTLAFDPVAEPKKQAEKPTVKPKSK